VIKIVDALCGAGKSTAIFRMMNEHPDKKYIYITPFLTEIEERVPEELPELDFKLPESKGKGGKLKDFKYLVKEGYNIAATHALFGMLTEVIVRDIIKWGYTLIIDEVTDCVGVLPKEYRKSDTDAMVSGQFITIDNSNRGKLTWNEDKYPKHDGKYKQIRNMCNLDMLYSYKDTFLMWEVCPKLLKGLDDIYILSYMFEGSGMSGWLKLNGISYKAVPHEDLGLRPEEELKAILRENLNLISNRTLSTMKQQKYTLSAGWFSRANTDTVKKFKAIMRSTVVSHKEKGGNVFWTTYKDYCKKLSGSGYSLGINDKDKNKVGKSFLPCNIRATNNYADYSLCIYAMNRFKNPIEVQYMRTNGVEVDEDLWANSEQIQFIFRGCIRQGKPMKLLILSDRMRKLLEDWLYEGP
jgi:hypothetical protein